MARETDVVAAQDGCMWPADKSLKMKDYYATKPLAKPCSTRSRMNVEVLATTLRSERGIGGTVASESALRSAGTLLSRVQHPPSAPWPDGGP
ncbi:hypothetical protein PoB_001758200 [Plakobranchus ocellatus]|uniref:Uncharacterized protein n=1 Tax=Plakobranchus ocellatus TaxID=259542 RepID=A0AAV3Z9C6_9GAST|nr:hypothetical protein PoB_001758200 [Plakobranchus ocellatus]